MTQPVCRRRYPIVLGRFSAWSGDFHAAPGTGKRGFGYSVPSPSGCVSDFVGIQFMKWIGWKGDFHGAPGTGPRAFAFTGECCAGRKTPLRRMDCLAAGIGDQAQVHTEKGGTCYSAGCDGLGKGPNLITYDGASGNWKGNGPLLRGGQMILEVTCDPVLYPATLFALRITGCEVFPQPPGTWLPALSYSACGDPNEPITVAWNIGPLVGCCSCPDASGAGPAPNLVLWIVFNCNHQIRLAIWKDVKNGIRRFGIAEQCNHPNDCCSPSVCADIFCDLIASITAVSGDCGFLAGTYTMKVQVGAGPGGFQWATDPGTFPSGATLAATCSTPAGGITVTISWPGTGSGSVTLSPDPNDLFGFENLDVQGDMSITALPGGDPPACTGVVHCRLTRAA